MKSVFVKVILFEKTYLMEIQEDQGRVILHVDQIHVADVELYACLEKLKERIKNDIIHG